MDKGLSFFRFFDLAFFAPGTLLFAALWYGKFLHQPVSESGDTLQGIFTVVFAIVAIYVLGLLCHGVQRLISLAVESYGIWKEERRPAPGQSPSQQTPGRKPWYAGLKESSRHELALYFWYMRATCWNLAAAVIPSAWLYSETYCRPGLLWSAATVAIVALTLMGYEFDKSLKKTMDR